MDAIESVLIIDDDETSVYLTKRVLKSMGISSQVEIAKNGTEGLNNLKQAKETNKLPNLILLDVNMHGMSGFDFLEQLARLNYVNLIDTKIVLLTDSQNPKIIGSAKHHLAAAYLPKPLTKEKLRSIFY